MRTTALGYYGMSNFGDDMFRSVVESRHSELWPGSQFRVFAPHGTGLRTDGFLRKHYQRVSSLGSILRLGVGVAAMTWADHIVLAGGSVFQRLNGIHRLQALLAGRSFRTISAIGVSFGPFASAGDETAIARFVQNFDFIGVRDRESLRYAERWGLSDRVAFGGDLAALYDFPEAYAEPSDSAFNLGIMPCAFPGFDLTAYSSGLSAMCRGIEAARGRTHVTIMSLNGNDRFGDRSLAHHISTALQRQGVDAQVHAYDGDVRRTARVIGRQSFNVSTRLHGGVASYLSHTPFAQIDYHPKCAGFMDDIGAPAPARLSRNASVAEWQELAGFATAPSAPAVTVPSYRDRAISAYKQR